VSRYKVRLDVAIVPVDEPTDVARFTDALRAELRSLCEDVEMGGTLATGLFSVWVTVDAQTPIDAVLSGTSAIRAAGHAVGANTASWPSADEWPEWVHTRGVEATLLDADESADEAPQTQQDSSLQHA
jgi:hypothetical protein